MNLEKMREENETMERLFYELKHNREKGFYFPDQDALNIAFYGNISFMERDVFLVHSLDVTKEYMSWTGLSEEEYWRAVASAPIVHITGNKPWTEGVSLSCIDEWWSFVDESPLKDAIHRYYNK